MLIRPILSAACLAVASAGVPASAEWFFQERGSAFGDDTTYLALTAWGAYAFGLRCTGADDLTAIFMTPEAVEDEAFELISITSPDLLVRVDRNEVAEIAATPNNLQGKLSFFGAGETSLAHQIIAARSGVSVAVRMLGTVYHETKFDVHRSTKVVTTLTEACGLPGE